MTLSAPPPPQRMDHKTCLKGSHLKLFSLDEDRMLKNFDIGESVFFEPTENLGIGVFILVLWCIPVEGIQPSPSPIRHISGRQEPLKRIPNMRQYVNIIERNSNRRKIVNQLNRHARRHPPPDIAKQTGYQPRTISKGRPLSSGRPQKRTCFFRRLCA